MCVLTTASAILALLALAGAAPVCEELVKPIHLEDVTPIMGKWWFLSGYTENQLLRVILRAVNSSWITLTPSGQADLTVMSQGNKINGKCEFPTHNITYKNGKFHMTQMSEGIPVAIEFTMLPSGPGYLATEVTHKTANFSINTLYLFGRSAKLSETEQQAFQRQAECMKFSTPAPYIYDGVTELCDEAQHKLMCEPLLKRQEIKDPASLMGRWVFLGGYVDHKMFIDMLRVASSAWMTWTPTSEKDALIMTQGNRLNGTCVYSTNNGNISNSIFHASEPFDGNVVTTKGWVVPSRQDILTMHLLSDMGDQKMKALYMFGRSGQKVSAADKENLEKQAECLGWINQAHFTYDGVTELCEEEPVSP